MLRGRAGQRQTWEDNPGAPTHGVLAVSLSLVYSDVSAAEGPAFDQAYLPAGPPSIHKVMTLISTTSATTAPGCEGLTQQGPSIRGQLPLCDADNRFDGEKRRLHQAAAPGLTLCCISACLCSISLFSTAESITSWSS